MIFLRGATVAKGKVVRVGDAARLEQLRALLEAIHGRPVTTAAAVDAGVSQLLASLGEGSDLAMFSIPSLQRMMAARTRSIVGTIAASVAASVTEYLHRSGVDAELIVGLSADGGTVAAQVVATAPAEPVPVQSDVLKMFPTIEA